MGLSTKKKEAEGPGCELRGTTGPKRKGCGKCGIPTTHAPTDCAKAWPRFGKQGCDDCLLDVHELSKCSNSMLSVCQICGHAEHIKKGNKKVKCHFLPADKNVAMIKTEDVDQFTPMSREKHLKTYSAPVTGPTTPSNSSTQYNLQNSANISPGSTQADGTLAKDINALTVTDDLDAAREELWRLVERDLLRPPKQQKFGEEKSEGETIKGNFYKIQVNPTVQLLRYSITLGETSKKPRAKSTGNPSIKPVDTQKDGQKGEEKDKKKSGS